MMSKIRSTSIHDLNADTGLSFFEKFAYLFLNWVNNQLPYFGVDKRIAIRPWDGKGWQREWNNTYPDSSAARKACDIFWRTLPWGEIRQELGEIHAFDTGCGHGNYGVRIQEGSQGLISSYTGIDAKRRSNWDELEEKHPNFKFIESRSTDIRPLIPKQANLFITQSAIEHFDQDLVFFEQIREHINKSDKPVIQIHLFPAGATLPLYLFHGFRQYVPRTISKITRLFGDDNNFYLFGLGGNAGKRLQWKYFTWPVLITRKYTKPTFDVPVYERELKKAFERDIATPTRSPIFWALVIHSNPSKSIWPS